MNITNVKIKEKDRLSAIQENKIEDGSSHGSKRQNQEISEHKTREVSAKAIPNKKHEQLEEDIGTES